MSSFGHTRNSSTTITNSQYQPRYEVVFDGQDDQYPERDLNVHSSAKFQSYSSASYSTSEEYTTQSSYEQQQQVSEHYVIPPEPRGYIGPETGNQHYVIPPEPRDYIYPETVNQHYVIPPEPRDYVGPETGNQHYVTPPEPRDYVDPETANQHYVIPPEPREYVDPETANQPREYVAKQEEATPQGTKTKTPPQEKKTKAPQHEKKTKAPPRPESNRPEQSSSQGGAAPIAGEFQNVDLSAKGDSTFDGHVKEKGIQEIILSKDDKGKLGLKTKSIKKGIYVMDVVRGSPSDKAGLFPGDRILQINGIKVDNFDEEKMHEIFKKMPVKGIRMIINKRPLEKTITLQKDNNGRLGFTLRSTKIHTVVKGSPAEIVGLSTDNYILEVNGTVVRGKREDEIRKLMENSGNPITITVMPYFLYEPLMKQIPIR